MQSANDFLLTNVVAKCSEYLESLLAPYNCIGIFSFARLHELKSLAYNCEKYIAEHLSTVYDEEEFKKLPIKTIVKILSRNDLDVKTEKGVVRVILSWINHNKEQRTQYFPDLLRLVKLLQLDKNVRRIEYMTNV